MKKISFAVVISYALYFFVSPIYALNTASSKKILHSEPCSTAAKYIKLINSGNYDSVGEIFSKNAIYFGPDGKTRHGSKEIGSFYACFLSIAKPQLRSMKFFAYGNECVMELERKRQSGEFTPEAVDHFTIDSAGKISKFIVYLRPDPKQTPALRSALLRCNVT